MIIYPLEPGTVLDEPELSTTDQPGVAGDFPPSPADLSRQTPGKVQDGRMMTTDVVLDSLGRVHELVPAVLKGLSHDDVVWQPDDGSNSIGWLVWHLTRGEDDQMADLGGRETVWSQGWSKRFALPYPETANGFGMSAADVAAFDVASVDLLIDYATAVAAQSREIVNALSETDYAKVIDTNWDPPVTIAVRLVSVAVEGAQHVGQAAYLRGLRERVTKKPSGWAGHV